MSNPLCPLLLLFLFASSTSARNRPNGLCAPNDDREDCLALVDFYKATGSKLPGFANRTSLCGWTGVTCNSTSRRVIALDLSFEGLSGTIPDSMGNLAAVQYLNLAGDDRVGNFLSGTIPYSMGSLSALQTLNLGFNAFSGTIPDSMGSLSALKTLDLSDNTALNGTIPDSLGSLSALQTLGLGYNALSGTIPDSLGSLSALRDLSLLGNSLSGTIPDSMGNLSALRDLNLNYNSLSGTIPDSMGNLAALQYLGLSNNQLTSWSSKICNLFAIGHLGHCDSDVCCDMSFNAFACPLPACAKLCKASCK